MHVICWCKRCTLNWTQTMSLDCLEIQRALAVMKELKKTRWQNGGKEIFWWTIYWSWSFLWTLFTWDDIIPTENPCWIAFWSKKERKTGKVSQFQHNKVSNSSKLCLINTEKHQNYRFFKKICGCGIKAYLFLP